VKFVARHSDLSSSDESESDSALETVPEDLDDTLDTTTSDEDSRIQARPKKALKRYSRRQIRAAAVRDRVGDGHDQKAQSKTPSDRKKRRRWEWTLGPLDEEVAEQNKPDLTETLATSSSTARTEAQASTSQTEESSEASAALTTHSPAPASASPSLILPQTIPLPVSPADAATEEGG
jgi:hypothetical protein